MDRSILNHYSIRNQYQVNIVCLLGQVCVPFSMVQILNPNDAENVCVCRGGGGVGVLCVVFSMLFFSNTELKPTDVGRLFS